MAILRPHYGQVHDNCGQNETIAAKSCVIAAKSCVIADKIVIIAVKSKNIVRNQSVCGALDRNKNPEHLSILSRKKGKLWTSGYSANCNKVKD